MKILTALALLIVAATFSQHSAATSEQLYAKGQVLSQQCLGCHGEFGIAPVATNPNLAGQNKEYLQYALKAYRDGKRKGGLAFIMQANASALSDQDIEALAVFFSSQSGKQAAAQQ
ncbi:c-type cytochrome [Rheinheimera faecalis]